jgi:hypothetical protein
MATTTHLPSKKHVVQLHPKKHATQWILLSVLLIVLSSLFVIKLTAQPVATTALPAPSVPLAYDATGAMLNSVVFPTYPDQRVQSPPRCMMPLAPCRMRSYSPTRSARFQSAAYDATAPC